MNHTSHPACEGFALAFDMSIARAVWVGEWGREGCIVVMRHDGACSGMLRGPEGAPERQFRVAGKGTVVADSAQLRWRWQCEAMRHRHGAHTHRRATTPRCR
jgi:hypothetical protein